MPNKKKASGRSHHKAPPHLTTEYLSADARRVHKALAGRDDVDWLDVKNVGNYSTEKVAEMWNELVATGLAGGRISYAEPGFVLKSE